MHKDSVTRAIKDTIDIVEYARSCGLEPVPHGTQGKYRSKHHDSLVIDPAAGLFSWNSRGVKGSGIDMCMYMRGIGERQAIIELREYLNDKPQHARFKKDTSSPAYAKAAQKTVTLDAPERSTQGYRRLYAYLTKTRGIDISVVQKMVTAKLIYQDDRNNACFCGYDYDGDMKYVAKRSTNTNVQFRGEAAGSRKEVGFSYNLVGKQCEKLFITEAPIDAMSIMSLLHMEKIDIDSYSYLSLGGTSENALEYHIQKHPETKVIYLCQDNDEPGNKSRELCRAKLAAFGFAGKVIDKPPLSKDFNTDLMAKIQEQAQQLSFEPAR